MPANQVAQVEPTNVMPVDPMVSMIERLVLDPNASMDKLERMLEMRERLEAGNARKAFDRAIAAAKADIPPILKNRQVQYEGKDGKPTTSYKHEDLAEIARTVDPILSQHGLSYRYRSGQDLQNGGRVTVTCVLSHRDGYSEETTLSGSPDSTGSKNNFQAVGSAVTYLQRYTLKLALGLAAAADDDAGKAGKDADAGAISEDQFRALRDLMEQAGGDEAKFLRFFKIEHLWELPVAKYGEADAMLRAKIARGGK